MTPEQMQLVRLTLAQATIDPLTLGRDFYRRLFVLAPDLRARFHGDIDAESLKLKETLTLAFGTLSDMRYLVATLDSLAKRNIAQGLSESQCRAIAQSLIWAIERRTGAAFTRQACNAWIAFLAVVMTCLYGAAVGLSRRAA
jgi:nitric oxide dioxygenase